MYSIIENSVTLICFTLFGYGIYANKFNLVVAAVAAYLLYPFVLELFMLIWEKFVFTIKDYKRFHQNKHLGLKQKIGIVYHERYNITAGGLEKCHPFDSRKYGRVYSYLEEQGDGIIEQKDGILEPQNCKRCVLTLCMSRYYLLQLCYSLICSRIVELPLCFLPAAFLRWRLLDSMLYATQGSIDGSCMALEKGWAINLSGGYHHAYKSSGGGFCVYPDITLTVMHLRKFHTEQQIRKIMIIDLDAHQGNGYERDLIDDEEIYIIDFYNHFIYPADSLAKKAISVDVNVSSNDNDETYLFKMQKTIPTSIDQFQPDFVIYNAGTDSMQGDPLGNLNISAEGIIQRDEFIFDQCLQRQIPILMLLSGGYQQDNAPVIAKSIINIYTKFDLKNKNSQNVLNQSMSNNNENIQQNINIEQNLFKN